MTRFADALKEKWIEILPKILPFADVASADLSLPRLLRLSLFQVTVGMAMVLLYGTLNRVMVVELAVPAWLVALMVSLPMVFAPLRALIGHRSDYHHSAFGLRRIPYIWMGSMLQFAGFTIMPFAILLLSDPGNEFALLGTIAAAVAFLLVGAGLHTIQTAGLALATDLAPPEKRPRVVALLYVTLLLGMVVSALSFGHALKNFSPGALIAVVQAVAALTLLLNLIALWKQEAIDIKRAIAQIPRPPFRESWQEFMRGGNASRLLIAVGLGTAGFSMQEILLEPYGAQVLGLTVAQTTTLTAILAGGTLAAFALSAYLLTHGRDSFRLATYGAAIGAMALGFVIFAAVFDSPAVFRIGTVMIGFGTGLFGVGTLTAAMGMAERAHTGLALGAWGAVQATSAGAGIALGGALRDVGSHFLANGALGAKLSSPSLAYSFVYSLEVVLLIGALAALIPLALRVSKGATGAQTTGGFGLDQML